MSDTDEKTYLNKQERIRSNFNFEAIVAKPSKAVKPSRKRLLTVLNFFNKAKSFVG
jgi:hypothetical protein